MVMILPEIFKCAFGNETEEKTDQEAQVENQHLNERLGKDEDTTTNINMLSDNQDKEKLTQADKSDQTTPGTPKTDEANVPLEVRILKRNQNDDEQKGQEGTHEIGAGESTQGCKKDLPEMETTTGNKMDQKDDIKMLASDATESITSIVKQPRISARLTLLQHLGLSREKRRGKNKQFVIALEAEEGKEKALLTLKRKINRRTAQKIIDDFNHSNSCMEQVSDAVEDLLETIKNEYDGISCSCTGTIPCCGRCDKELRCEVCSLGPISKVSKFRIMKNIATNYYDIVKDLTLVVNMMYILDSHFFDTELFNATTWILLCSLLIPLMVSAVETAVLHPTAVLDRKTFMAYKKNPPNSLRATVFFGYVFVPALIISNIEEAEVKREHLLEAGKRHVLNLDGQQIETDQEILKELEDVEGYLESLNKARLVFYKNEASMEIPVQLTVQLLMLLMTLTETPTHNSREAFFAAADVSIIESWNKSSFFLLALIFLSLMKSCRTYVKIVKGQKSNFLPTVAKLVLGLRAFVVSSTRVCCYLAFFGPFFGILSSLQHLQAEQMDWDPDLFAKLTGTNSYWDMDTAGTLFKKSKPDYTAYTVIDLKTASLIFVAITGVYSIVIASTKSLMNRTFWNASLQSKIKYVIEGLNMPNASKDWDEDESEEDTCSDDYRKRRRMVLRETITMMIIHTIFNLVFIIPTLVTGNCNKTKQCIGRVKFNISLRCP